MGNIFQDWVTLPSDFTLFINTRLVRMSPLLCDKRHIEDLHSFLGLLYNSFRLNLQ